jgi:uncharacterized protein YjiS (DUF1127 family)
MMTGLVAMNAYSSQEELALLPSNRISYAEHYATADSRRVGLRARIAAFFKRQATLNELRQMTDRELSDIGLHRGDLHHVFDPAFAASRAR